MVLISHNNNHPDIIFVYKQSDSVFLIDVAIPGDSRISSKTVEKLTKYVDLKVEITRMWRPKKVSIIPTIIGISSCRFIILFRKVDYIIIINFKFPTNCAI